MIKQVEFVRKKVFEAITLDLKYINFVIYNIF